MAHVAVVPKTIKYPDADGLPMAENESQFWPILYVGSALDRYYQDREDVYVVGNLLLYYQKAPPGEPASAAKSVSPDLMVVLGASKRVRSSYVLWQESKAPDFVLEIASESTYRIDQSEKPRHLRGHGGYGVLAVRPGGQLSCPAAFGQPSCRWRLQADPCQGAIGRPAVASQRGVGAGVTSDAGCASFGRRCTFTTRCAGSTCGPTGKKHRPGKKRHGARQEADQAREEEAQARRQAEGRLEQTEGQLRQTQDRLREEQAARQVLEDELRELRRRE